MHLPEKIYKYNIAYSGNHYLKKKTMKWFSWNMKLLFNMYLMYICHANYHENYFLVKSKYNFFSIGIIIWIEKLSIGNVYYIENIFLFIIIIIYCYYYYYYLLYYKYAKSINLTALKINRYNQLQIFFSSPTPRIDSCSYLLVFIQPAIFFTYGNTSSNNLFATFKNFCLVFPMFQKNIYTSWATYLLFYLFII